MEGVKYICIPTDAKQLALVFGSEDRISGVEPRRAQAVELLIPSDKAASS